MTLNIVCELRANPTEDEEVLRTVLKKFVPGEIKEDLRSTGKYFYLMTEGIDALTFFSDWVRNQSLLDTVRNRFLRNVENETLTTVYFNRNAAVLDRLILLDFEDDPPLGPVMLQIIASDPTELMKAIDRITPSTIEGEEMTDEQKKEYFRRLMEKKKSKEKRRQKAKGSDVLDLT